MIERATCNLKRWIGNGTPDEDDLDYDSLKILKHVYKKTKGLVYLKEDEIVACIRNEKDKVLCKYQSILLQQLYQTELLFRSHNQSHHSVDKVYNKTQKLFE